MRSRACSMSASVSVVLVAKLEDLFHYLSHGRQRIELTPLNLVEQALQLGVAFDRALQVCLCPARGDREHLAGEVLPAPFVEQAVRLQMRPMLSDLLPEHVDVLVPRRLRQHDRRTPGTL